MAKGQKSEKCQHIADRPRSDGYVTTYGKAKARRVVTRPQAIESLVAKNAYPCRCHPPQKGGDTEDSPNKREVETIFRGSHEVENSLRAQEKYDHEAEAPPNVVVQTINSSSRRALCQNQRTLSSRKMGAPSL